MHPTLMNDPRPTVDPDAVRRPGPRRRRSSLPPVLAIAVGLTGLVWMLQGLGILSAGESFMIGDPRWAVIGAAFMTLGLVLAVRARRTRGT